MAHCIKEIVFWFNGGGGGGRILGLIVSLKIHTIKHTLFHFFCPRINEENEVMIAITLAF